MEQIRENMFFVVTGVIVILCIIFHFNPFFSVRSWEAKNEELHGNVQGLEAQLKKWSKEEFVPNESALAAGETFHGEYVTMFDGLKDGNGQTVVEGVKDMFARTVFPERLPGLGPDEQKNAQIFLQEYRGLVKALKDEVTASSIRTSVGTWMFWDWGQQLPDAPAQREAATREYWLTSEILDVTQQKSLNVVAVDKLEIDPGIGKNADYSPEARSWRRKGDYFDAIPFVLELKMEFQKFPLLVAKLLTTKTPIYIDRVSIGRLNDEERTSLRLGPDALRTVLVSVKLHCLALNYREVVVAAGASTTPGAMGSRTVFGGGVRRPDPRTD